jgi:5-methylcytosine-specific restriction protein A
LHLFESLGKGKKQRYLGQFLLKGSRIVQGPDKTGAIRDTIIFDLLPGGMLPSAGLNPVAAISPKPVVAPTLAALRAAAIAASKANAGKTTLPVPPSVQQQRSDTVKDYVLMRPNGICECCGKPAPFLRKNNTPYLEAHHIERLSDDGIDHPQNMAAICPACHCEIHFGVNGDAVNSKLASKIKVKW